MILLAVQVFVEDIPFLVSKDNENIINEIDNDIKEFGENFPAYGILRLIKFEIPFAQRKFVFVEMLEDYVLHKNDIDLFSDEKVYEDTLINLKNRFISEDE